MSESGTNSVKPPVSFWMLRSRFMWRIQCSRRSTCPYMMVDVVRMPWAWAEVMTSIHCSTVMRPRAITSRISWSRISADVPGRVPSPTSFSAARYSGMGSPERVEPYRISSGENACRCISGRAALIARHRSM